MMRMELPTADGRTAAPADFPAAGSAAPAFQSFNAFTGETAEDLLAELELLRAERADRDELEDELREAKQTITDLRAALVKRDKTIARLQARMPSWEV